MRSLSMAFILFVIGFAASVAWGAESQTEKLDVVYLDVRESDPIDGPSQAGGLLVRELARQAFLIAARDECGLATRDRTLRDDFPTSPAASAVPFEILTIAPDAQLSDVTVNLSRRTNGRRKQLWETTTPLSRVELITKLVEKAEGWSRTEFKDALREQGYTGTVPPMRESATVPPAAEKQLWEWNEIAVFATLRTIHTEIREKGESPELLSGLAIGYANLGLMTELRWSPAHKAFKARALLYAERLLQHMPESGWALAHRAYVRAVVGMHAPAAADARAAIDGKGKTPARALPAWLDTIEHACEGEAKPDVNESPEPQRSLQWILWLRTTDRSGLREELPRSAASVFEQHPDCFRIVEALWALRELGLTRMVNSQALPVFSNSLNKRLVLVPALPETVRKRLGAPAQDSEAEIGRCAAIIADLKEAGRADHDWAEPSLTVLGNLLDDIGFQLAWRQLDNDKRILAVSTADDLPLLRPLGAHHPFGPFLDSFSGRLDERRTVVDKFRRINWSELEFTENPLIIWLCGTNKKRLERLRRVALSHTDPIFDDVLIRRRLGFLNRSEDDAKNAQTAALLRSVAPKSPAIVALLIDIDWKGTERQAKQLEKDFAEQPIVLSALAQKHLQLRQYRDAERCLRQVVHLQPTHASYRSLASVFDQEKDWKRWQQTLEASLKLPSLGLEGARVQADIAEFHLRRNEADEALPFAEAAAQSYSAWSLLILARCYELKGDWAKAEQLVREEGDRYRGDSLYWLAWCRRTGHGDAKAAQERALKYLEKLGVPAPQPALGKIGNYYLLTDEPEKALAVFKREYQRTQKPYAGLHAAILADRLGDTAVRDSLLTQLADDGTPDAAQQARCYAEVADAMRTALAAGKPKPLALARVESAIQKSGTGQPTSLYYLVGLFFENRGDKEKSRAYLMRSATSPYYREYSHVLAVRALRDRKISIGPVRQEELGAP